MVGARAGWKKTEQEKDKAGKKPGSALFGRTFH